MTTAKNKLVVIAVIASIGMCGCVNQKPSVLAQSHSSNTNYKDAGTGESMTAFEELVVSLVSDSVDLLPGTIPDVIAQGTDIPPEDDEIETSVLYSSNNEEIAHIAGLIVQRVYGNSVGTSVKIPQTIYFTPKPHVTNNDLFTSGVVVASSKNRSRDSYNTCLNLLVNILAKNFNARKLPVGGVYIRDDQNDLYLYSEVANEKI